MDRLPQEVLNTVLEKVFMLLPHEDRKAAVMVNRVWRQIGEAPHLWSWVVLPEVDKDNSELVSEMLATRRLEKVANLIVVEASDTLLPGLVQHTSLKSLTLCDVSENLLRGVAQITGLKRLVFEPTNDNGSMFYDSQQFVDLLTSVTISSNSSLEMLDLSGFCLRYLPPNLLASAITRLVEVDLSQCSLFVSQIAALMKAIDKGDIPLKHLNLWSAMSCNGREGIHDLRPLVKLVSVDISQNIFIHQELVDFFSALSPNSKLRELRMQGARIKDRGRHLLSEDMEENTQLMATAVNFLGELTMDANTSQVITFVREAQKIR